MEAPPTSAAAVSAAFLRPRREPFEHGLLPISKLMFTDGTLTLSSIRDQLLHLRSPESCHVSAAAIAEALQISDDQTKLVIDTLNAVKHYDGDGDGDGITDPEAVGVYELMLFLYIQSYKRLLPKAHKDSAAVADVWPSMSAFDGYLSALSPLQLVRSNSRRSMPSQADEEAHQLSYLQKHIGNILALLAEADEGEGDESLVLSLERFEHLGFLIQFGERGTEGMQLSQAVPFFANSDPDMPAAPVAAAQVHEWLLNTIAASLEHTAERQSAKENGPVNNSDPDVTMADATTSRPNNASYFRSQTFVEGFSKASVLKQSSDIEGRSVKVLNNHDSVIYILAPLHYATVYGCSDTTVVLGAVGKALRVEHCERVQVITATKRVCIANCRECIFFLGVNRRPLIVGDNHKLQVAPYNTFYTQLEEHMALVGIDATINRWDQPMVLGMVDPHDSLSHPAGVSDAQAESASPVDPDQFTNFLIPTWFGGESKQLTKCNPFSLPENYLASQKKKHSILGDVQQAIRSLQVEENKKRELASALHLHFKDWLYASGNIRQLFCLQGD